MPAPEARPGLALCVTLLMQIIASFCLAVPSVLAPAVAPALGLRADRVGLFVGTAYLAAMASGLLSGGWVARMGAVRVCQMALIAFGAGMLAITAGHPLALLGAALVVGAGYGVINPTSASLLNQHAPPRRRGLFFSVKQSGVPLGVALAGVLLPWGLVTIGWQSSLVALGAGCGVYLLMLLAARRRLDSRTVLSGEPAAERPPALFRVFKDPELRRLSMSSFAFAFSQLAFLTFLVSYLNLELGHSLALAAGVLAASQVVSTLARIGWGYAGDRWFDPGTLLGWLGIGAALAFVALAGVGLLPESGVPPHADTSGLRIGAAVAAAMLCALTAMGWNGVFFAELARRSSRSEMASLAGATQFVTFFGSMSGPVVFGEVIRHGGSYRAAFLALAILPLAAGISMVRKGKKPSPRG